MARLTSNANTVTIYNRLNVHKSFASAGNLITRKHGDYVREAIDFILFLIGVTATSLRNIRGLRNPRENFESHRLVIVGQ
jgi:hypothetical protein